MRVPLILPALLALAASGSSAGPAAPSSDSAWYSIVTEGGTPIGHASREILQKSDGRDIVDTQAVDVEEQPGPLAVMSWRTLPKQDNMSWRTVRTEDRAGRTVAISASAMIGRDWTRTEARIAADKAEVTRQTPTETRASTITLPPDVRFDGGTELLRSWDPAAIPRLEFEDFNIDSMTVDRVTIEAVHDAPPDPQGRLAVLRKHYDGDQLRAVARLLLDGEHRIVEVRQPMFGTSILIKATDRDTALKPNSPYRILPDVMTKSPFLISTAAKLGHIRYRFSFRDGIEFPLPQTGEQRATVEAGFVTLDICRDCGPGLPTDKATLADALKPTAWLQSDHPRLKAIADPIAKLPISDSAKMNLLLERAKPYLRNVDFTGHYSALETLERRSGDCTEAAVLLAALGRAAGIPTRVADGLVYSRESYHGVSNVFMPHSWTLAWADGKWRSFDLALDDFDSTHIAITVGDGDERSLLGAGQLAGLLRWEEMAEVRTRPGN
jgi:transglutaminase superfamily protein